MRSLRGGLGTLLGLSVLWSAACGDDDPKGAGDAAVLSDAAVQNDAAAGGDGGGMDAGSDAGSAIDGGGDAAPAPEAGSDGGPVAARDTGTQSGPGNPAADAGPLACPGGCNDNVDCTIDTCAGDRCLHTIDDSVCQPGFSCRLSAGCQQGTTCMVDANCADGDACTSNERCEPGLGRCVWDPLDSDGDGYAPSSCGGLDCNDSNGLLGPSAAEACDGVDNDCDGVVDDQASCGTGQTCVNGACTCRDGWEQCLFGCVDLNADPNNCGACGTSCGSGGVCTNGACSCPASAQECDGACTNVQTSMTHCGACGMACSAFSDDGQLQGCLGGACVGCGGEGQPCCRLTGCGAGLSCQGTQGAADSQCVCPANAGKCGDAGVCTDLSSDEDNCGACGTACQASEVCVARGAGAACASCGELGEPCCDGLFGFGTCGGGNVCGPNRTCVRANVPPPPDAGESPPDAGAGMDAGTPEQDAGMPEQDASPSAEDAGAEEDDASDDASTDDAGA